MSGMTRCWRCWCFHLALASLSLVEGAMPLLAACLLGLASSLNCVLAQITPDGTLPNNSIVTPQGNTSLIEGGTQAGSNLFHSFEQFSIPIGGEASFNNAADIQNIISRVTGESISNIDGLLRANGTANLFLLNPNGITFGPNASLNIGGSFVGTTAFSLNFTDGTFSVTAPTTTPLLILSVPIGLQFGPQAGSIHNQSQASDILGPVGLQVQSGKTLALLGGDVRLDGGYLYAPGGRVELGGLAGAGTVGLNVDGNNLGLSFPNGVARADLSLTNAAKVSANGEGGGDIQVWHRRVTLTNGSQIDANTLGAEPGGTLTVNASESVEVIGISADSRQFPSGLFANVRQGATGTGGDLALETRRLIVSDGAQIAADTRGQGNGGSLTVTASESVEVIGRSAGSNLIRSVLSVATDAEGDAGDLRIETGRLIIRDGAQIVSTTYDSGAAGSLAVSARESVEVIGRSADGRVASALGSQVAPGATGNGGNVTVETGQLIVRDGAQIGTSTFGSGKAGSLALSARESVEVIGRSADGRVASGLFTNSRLSVSRGEGTGAGGNLTLETRRLTVRDGAEVSVGTDSAGPGGTLEVRAFESVEVIGKSANGRPSLLTAGATGTGDAGDLTIETGWLNVRDEAEVTVSSSTRSGNAGNIEVAARSIQLDNKALLSSETTRGQGNIFLNSDDLVLRRNSNITTNATGAATGGNITIDTDILAALENSNITANAEEAFGGRVIINAQGIFGTEFREIENPATSDITATSELGPEFSGAVEINTPDINPSSGLVNVPAQPTYTEVAQACTPGGNQNQSEFVVTGRGGLPPNPGDALSTDAVMVDLVTLNPEVAPPSTPVVSPRPTSSTLAPIVEAQGWVIDAKGNVTLIANTPITPYSDWLRTAGCRAFNQQPGR